LAKWKLIICRFDGNASIASGSSPSQDIAGAGASASREPAQSLVSPAFLAARRARAGAPLVQPRRLAAARQRDQARRERGDADPERRRAIVDQRDRMRPARER